jgi:hypothetical protein
MVKIGAESLSLTKMEIAIHVGVWERGKVLGVVLVCPAHLFVVSGGLCVVELAFFDESLDFQLNLSKALKTWTVCACSLLVLFCL